MRAGDRRGRTSGRCWRLASDLILRAETERLTPDSEDARSERSLARGRHPVEARRAYIGEIRRACSTTCTDTHVLGSRTSLKRSTPAGKGIARPRPCRAVRYGPPTLSHHALAFRRRSREKLWTLIELCGERRDQEHWEQARRRPRAAELELEPRALGSDVHCAAAFRERTTIDGGGPAGLAPDPAPGGSGSALAQAHQFSSTHTSAILVH
ncbi:hypothetical protein C8Q79DRAFT_975098 [Trametes meyenii]|nr:hypothetical protein C8Q79DRAFT_975098 [Trametes meyenii]